MILVFFLQATGSVPDPEGLHHLPTWWGILSSSGSSGCCVAHAYASWGEGTVGDRYLLGLWEMKKGSDTNYYWSMRQNNCQHDLYCQQISSCSYTRGRLVSVVCFVFILLFQHVNQDKGAQEKELVWVCMRKLKTKLIRFFFYCGY